MSDFSHFRRALMTRLAELDHRLASIEAELDAPHSQDWEELAVEREGEEVLEQLGQSGQEEIRRIQAALARMRDGTYGTCVECGEAISDARLQVLPATPFCRTCAVNHA